MAAGKCAPREGAKQHVYMRGGSSLVKFRPLFSHNSKYLFVCCGTAIKVFSTNSGECVHNLLGHKSVVIGVQLNPKNHLQLLSCDKKGSIIKWDYEDGVQLKKFKLDFKVSMFFAPQNLNDWFVTSLTKQGEHCHLSVVSWTPENKNKANLKSILKNVIPEQNKIVFGVQDEFVAAVIGCRVAIHSFKDSCNFSLNTGARQLTCLAAHPKEYCLATGDITGRIVVWYDITGKKLSTVYHWHTLPVNSISFSAEGSHFFSGGEECVLVKWRLGSGNSKYDRQYLPRMGMPLSFVTSSPNNFFVATSHVDNAIHLVNSHNTVDHVYQGLTQGHMWQNKIQSVGINDPIPTGVLFDPRSKAIVMNGKPGHLQFYSIFDDKQLYNLDIVGQNYLTQERHVKIINTDVIKAAFDDNGDWLATVEYRNDGEMCIELRLKFWKFNSSSQRFKLNTTVEFPHKEIVSQVLFRPPMASEDDESPPLLMTLSNLENFKLWSTVGNPRAINSDESWTCQSVGFYHSSPPSCACFSEDGSLLAVAFDAVLTLWIPENNVIKTSLVHPKVEHPIRNVEFGRKDCCQFVVAANKSSVTVWNIASLSISWQVELDANQLISNPFSNMMAVFTHTNKLYVFCPSSSSPIYVNKFMEKDIIHSAFIPYQYRNVNTDDGLSWEDRSRLVFVDSMQRLFVVSGYALDNDKRALKMKSNIPKTPFGMLIAEKNISNVEKQNVEIHAMTGMPGKKQISELIMSSAHVLPPVSTLCLDFINSLLIPKGNSLEATFEKMDVEELPKITEESMDCSNVDSDESR